jgi:hypothetical protein
MEVGGNDGDAMVFVVRQDGQEREGRRISSLITHHSFLNKAILSREVSNP